MLHPHPLPKNVFSSRLVSTLAITTHPATKMLAWITQGPRLVADKLANGKEPKEARRPAPHNRYRNGAPPPGFFWLILALCHWRASLRLHALRVRLYSRSPGLMTTLHSRLFPETTNSESYRFAIFGDLASWAALVFAQPTVRMPFAPRRDTHHLSYTCRHAPRRRACLSAAVVHLSCFEIHTHTHTFRPRSALQSREHMSIPDRSRALSRPGSSTHTTSTDLGNSYIHTVVATAREA